MYCRGSLRCSSGGGLHESVLVEVVLLPQFLLPLGGQGLEISAPAGAEVDLPSPEAADERFGVFVVLSA